ncbi:hypothetical protein JMG10_25535 [Nostoc ellipsosporum NOK]|nr:hypothetical protein [Nostoc ellipsosporum NOK]
MIATCSITSDFVFDLPLGLFIGRLAGGHAGLAGEHLPVEPLHRIAGGAGEQRRDDGMDHAGGPPDDHGEAESPGGGGMLAIAFADGARMGQEDALEHGRGVRASGRTVKYSFCDPKPGFVCNAAAHGRTCARGGPESTRGDGGSNRGGTVVG